MRSISLDIWPKVPTDGPTPVFCSNSNCPFKTAAAIGFIDDKPFMINTRRVRIGQMLYIGDQEIGLLSEVKPDRIFVKNHNNVIRCYRIGDSEFSKITTIAGDQMYRR